MARVTTMLTTFLIIFVVVFLAFLAWSIIGSHAEQTMYSVVSRQGNIEVRDYGPMIVAEVETTGEREMAINAGFRVLADYIFGNNRSNTKVAMTAPVTQQVSEKIAMTAPVTQQSIDGKWKVRFIMPAKHSLSSLPLPNTSSIVIKEVPAQRFLVIRFSGVPTQASLESWLEKLKNHARTHNIQAISAPTYAFFNPPWTLPMMRRNEIMIEIERSAQ